MNGDIRIEVQSAGVFNYAMQQNYIPLIRSIGIVNAGETAYEGISVRAVFEPEFAKPFEYTVQYAEAGRTAEITPVNKTRIL